MADDPKTVIADRFAIATITALYELAKALVPDDPGRPMMGITLTIMGNAIQTLPLVMQGMSDREKSFVYRLVTAEIIEANWPDKAGPVSDLAHEIAAALVNDIRRNKGIIEGIHLTSKEVIEA